MCKMLITVVIDTDRGNTRKVKNKILKAAHKVMVSSSATYIESRKEDDNEQLALFDRENK